MYDAAAYIVVQAEESNCGVGTGDAAAGRVNPINLAVVLHTRPAQLNTVSTSMSFDFRSGGLSFCYAYANMHSTCTTCMHIVHVLSMVATISHQKNKRLLVGWTLHSQGSTSSPVGYQTTIQISHH